MEFSSNRLPYNECVIDKGKEKCRGLDDSIEGSLFYRGMTTGLSENKKNEGCEEIENDFVADFRAILSDVNKYIEREFGSMYVPFNPDLFTIPFMLWIERIRKNSGNIFSIYFDSLIRMSDKDYDGARNVFKEMKKQKLFPNLIKAGKLYPAKVDLVKRLSSFFLVRSYHRVASMFDHTVNEVIPSIQSVMIALKYKFIYGFIIPLFKSVLLKSEKACLDKDEDKMNSYLNRVKAIDFDILYQKH